MSQKKDMMLAVKVSLYANVVLCAIKVIAMFIVNSLAIMADLGISCVALAVSIILYYAIKMADKPADFFHNYGYGKIENVCELIEGAVLIGLALSMTFQAVSSLIHIENINSPDIGLISSFLGVTINFWGAGFILKLARKSISPALKAEGIHFRLEGYISLAITISFALYLIANYVGFYTISNYIDPIATIVVSIIIAIPSARLLKEAFLKLLDASIGEEGQMDVLKILAKHVDSYCDFKHIKTRSAGRKKFVDVHLVMPEHIPFKDAHSIIKTIEDDIVSTIVESDVAIKMEPCSRQCSFIKHGQKCPYV